MRTTSLDASALNANGGAFEGLSRVLASIVDRMARAQDRRDEVQYEDARAGYQERRQTDADKKAEERAREARRLQYALAGVNPDDPNGMQVVAQQVRAKNDQSQAAAALRLATERMNAIRDGNVAPVTPLAIEGQAAAEGASARAAERDLAGARATAIKTRALASLLGGGNEPKPVKRDVQKMRVGDAEVLVEIMPDGTYRELTKAGATPATESPAVGADARKAAREALARYHEGDWGFLDVGKGDVAPLRKLTPEALRAASAESGLMIPDLTAPAPAAAAPTPSPGANRARAALEAGMAMTTPAAPAAPVPAAIPRADPGAMVISPQSAPGGAFRGGSYRLPGTPAPAASAAPEVANPADIQHHLGQLATIADVQGQARYLAQLKREQPAVYLAIRASAGK